MARNSGDPNAAFGGDAGSVSVSSEMSRAINARGAARNGLTPQQAKHAATAGAYKIAGTRATLAGRQDEAKWHFAQAEKYRAMAGGRMSQEGAEDEVRACQELYKKYGRGGG